MLREVGGAWGARTRLLGGGRGLWRTRRRRLRGGRGLWDRTVKGGGRGLWCALAALGGGRGLWGELYSAGGRVRGGWRGQRCVVGGVCCASTRPLVRWHSQGVSSQCPRISGVQGTQRFKRYPLVGSPLQTLDRGLLLARGHP